MTTFFKKTFFVALAMALLALTANPAQTAGMPASFVQEQQAAGDPGQAVFFAVSRQGGDSTNEIYRYTVAGPNEPALLETTITRPNITNPYGLAFSDTGELYISNAYVNPSIARLLDPAGTATTNGPITESSLVNPVGLVIREGLLYVSQVAGNVEVFSLDASGNGTLISTISANLAGGSSRNVAINPSGDELLVAQCCGGDSIVRYTIDGLGVATFKGVINGNGLNGAHDLVFSPWGELFVANAHGGTISRFMFDSNGNEIPNGVLTGNGLSGPIGLDFSPWGELFAADHNDAAISRWMFSDDTLHTAIPNGFFSTPNTLADLMFFPSFTPTIEFAALSAQVQLEMRPSSSNDRFMAKGSATLKSASNGINPLAEEVRVSLGNYAGTIPAGSFQQQTNGKYIFSGQVGGVTLTMEIRSRNGNTFDYRVDAIGIDFDGTTLPLRFKLRIGDDLGSSILPNLSLVAQ